ncbi:MAG: class I SAM-dependent methyltransferase [Archangium sp.]|nr:class I SAM-dependent methyltransferase [Archangium sp.]
MAPVAKVMGLPDYDSQLSSFHQAFEGELRAIIASLPLAPGMRVLDLACGDGFYARCIADRYPGCSITGADLDPEYLAKARSASKGIEFVRASFDHLPFREGSFDLVWCAQSLYSLPDPVVALQHMARVLEPGGVVAVLENDTLHTALLPWPASLELPLRTAELRSFQQGSRPGRFYVGRRLPAVLAAAGLEPGKMTTHAFDRQAPLGEAEQRLLASYFEDINHRVTAHLEPASLQRFRELIDPASPQYLLRLPHFSVTWVNVLALGRKP